MKTHPKIHMYYGAEALGYTDKGFSKPETFRGRIGGSSLQKVEDEPTIFAIKPFLKPIEAVPVQHPGDLWAESIRTLLTLLKVPEKRDSAVVLLIRQFADITNRLRDSGYDIDGLLEGGFALPHPDFDAKSLL